RLLGADCVHFFFLAGASARRKVLDQAQMWLWAGEQRLQRFCRDVDQASKLPTQARNAMHEAGNPMPDTATRPIDQLLRWEDVLADDPEAAWAYQLRGQIFAESGDFKKAEEDYQGCIPILRVATCRVFPI